MTEIIRGADISSCGKFRYSLERRWSLGTDRSLVLMANPSDADASVDDPTIRNLIKWHRSWGYGGFIAVNINPRRSRKPDVALGWLAQELRTCGDGVSEALVANHQAIRVAAHGPSIVLVAYGVLKDWVRPVAAGVVETIRSANKAAPFYCLGLTACGDPKHPMARGVHRIPDSIRPIPWSQK